MRCTLKDSNLISYCLFLFPLSAGEALLCGQKCPKTHRRDVRSTLCTKNFLKIVAVVICELIALTPKITHQQREMICAILRQFFQNFETICNPSLYGVLAYGKLCAYSVAHTFPRKKQVCGGGLENVCESAVIVP